jgi:hypothetical protein
MKTLGTEMIEKLSLRVDCPANFELLEFEKVLSIDRPLKIKGEFNKSMKGFLLEY